MRTPAVADDGTVYWSNCWSKLLAFAEAGTPLTEIRDHRTGNAGPPNESPPGG